MPAPGLPEHLQILLAECDISFSRTGGPGGQHRNKVETAVRLVHRPTGITIVAGQERSQYRNRLVALERLHERLRQIEQERTASEKRSQRRRTRPTPGARERRLREKRVVGEKKRRRGPVPPPDNSS